MQPGTQASVLADLLGHRVELETTGGESRTYRLHGTEELVTVPVGWPEEAEPAADLARRAELLRRVRERVSVPVPEVLRVLPESGLTVVRRLPGTRLIELEPDRRDDLARHVATTLGTVLAELHTWAPEAFAGLAEADEDEPADWLAEAGGLAAELAPRLTAAQRGQVDRFLAAPAPAPADRLVLSHQDLGIEHVLVSGGAVTGIIDWDDAGCCDPAYDLGLVLRDLGPHALDAALTAYGAAGGDPDEVAGRAWFYARCKLLEDLAFGHAEDRPAYVAKSLAGWARLFEPDR